MFLDLEIELGYDFAVGLASPGGLTALYRHCIQRPLLVMLPSFSRDEAQGSMKTSVLTIAGSIQGPPERPVSFQKVDVDHPLELGQGLADLVGVAPVPAGFIPQAKKPLNLPLYIASKS